MSLNILKAFSRVQCEVACWPLGGGADAPPEDHQMIQQAFARTKFFDKNAPCLRIYHQFSMAEMVGKGLHCGFPIFELDKFTEVELHHLRSLDLVFAPSHWAAQVLRANGIENVAIAPFGVDRAIFNEMKPTTAVVPREDGTESLPLANHTVHNATIFLNIGKWELRKGHDILCRAFNRAFEPSDDVGLIMHCHNPFLERNGGNDQWKSFYLNSPMGRAGKIMVLPGRLPAQQNLAALMHQADCGVFPSRAEGWNCPLMEMMSCGKPVITTDYSAHTEFCNGQNSILLPVEATEVAEDGIWFHGQGSWASLGDHQLDLLVDAMRRVHGMKQQGILRRNDAGIETAKRFSWENCVSHLFQGLQQ